MPLFDAPAIGSAVPPLPSLNGTRYRSNRNGLPSSTNSLHSSRVSRTLPWPLRVLEIVGLAAGEDDVLAVRAPARIALDVGGIVRSRQRAEDLRLAVVDAQNPLDREEQLRERQVRHGHEHGFVLDRADHVPAVRRHLREQAERLLAILLPVVVPRDDVARRQHHLLLDRRDDVGALAVGVIDVHGEQPAVLRERVAIAADGQVLQNHRRRLRRGNRPKPPANPRGVLDGVDERQVHLPIEQRRPHLVLGGPDGEGRRRDDLDRACPA